jgi:hypothetical protein
MLLQICCGRSGLLIEVAALPNLAVRSLIVIRVWYHENVMHCWRYPALGPILRTLFSPSPSGDESRSSIRTRSGLSTASLHSSQRGRDRVTTLPFGDLCTSLCQLQVQQRLGWHSLTSAQRSVDHGGRTASSVSYESVAERFNPTGLTRDKSELPILSSAQLS